MNNAQAESGLGAGYTRASRKESHSKLPTSLRAIIIATALWVLSLSLTVIHGSIAAVLGCLSACFFVDLYMRKPPLNSFRNSTIIAACALIALIAVLVAGLITSTTLLPNLMGPVTSFNVSEFIKWLGLSLALTLTLRALSQRSSYGAILEIIFVASAFVITLSAHRNGMIHRPFFIGDFALIRGIDPSAILLALGCGAVMSLSALLMMENNQRRLPYHFAVLGLLCFSLLVYVRMFGLPTPQLTDDLGLTGQEQNGNSRQDDNPFRDGENNTDDKEAPVAIVLFRDDYEPASGSYYFRESAYSQFNGTMLDFTTRGDMDQDLIERFTSNRIETEQAPVNADQRQLVRTSIGMLVAHRNPFGLDSPTAYQNTPNPNNLRFKRTYDAYSLVPDNEFGQLIGKEMGRPGWSDEVWQEYLTLPDDPRYQQLAQTIIADLKPQYANDPFARALAIKTYLDENGIYSLKNEHAYAEDPAASFLFGDLTGYCMHFSFAATYLFRSIGIPARVGIGYSVPASNRAGGSSLLIQAIHGHAWPEIYVRGQGWVIVDPAPQQTLVDMTTDPQNSLQQLLGDMLRDEASFDEFLESQRDSWFPIQTVLNILYASIAAIFLTAYAIKFYRLWIPLQASANTQYRVSYRAALDKLSAIGFSRRRGESREDFARRVSELSPSFASITGRHLSYALGSIQDQPATIDSSQWLQLNREINAQISSNIPTWKKLLAWLNPFSWLMSK